MTRPELYRYGDTVVWSIADLLKAEADRIAAVEAIVARAQQRKAEWGWGWVESQNFPLPETVRAAPFLPPRKSAPGVNPNHAAAAEVGRRDPDLPQRLMAAQLATEAAAEAVAANIRARFGLKAKP